MKKLLALIIKDITFNLRIFSITFIGFTALIFINTSKYGDGGNNIVNYLFFCGAASLVAAQSHLQLMMTRAQEVFYLEFQFLKLLL